MGLNAGDQEKVPTELPIRDCYERIWTWHMENGEAQSQSRDLSPTYLATYLRILPKLPPQKDALPVDLDFLFVEVVYGTFEWSYHDEDHHGIKMAAYAFHAIDKLHKGDLSAAGESAARSALAELRS